MNHNGLGAKLIRLPLEFNGIEEAIKIIIFSRQNQYELRDNSQMKGGPKTMVSLT